MDRPLISPAGVLFDLDGTLLDTALDMAHALNQLLKEEQRVPLPLATIRPVVSYGSRGLLELGLNITAVDPDFERLKQRFLEIYAADLATHTCLFDGMAEVLNELETRSISWGIVTNKPGWLTEPLLQQLDLYERSAVTISGDTLALRKPHPQPLLYACQQLQVAPDTCLYIGDAERDVMAGNSAGMTTVVARYGYLHAHEKPEQWGADMLIDNPRQLLVCLGWRVAS